MEESANNDPYTVESVENVLNEFEELFSSPKGSTSAPKRRLYVGRLEDYLCENLDNFASVATQEHYLWLFRFLFDAPRAAICHNGYKQSVCNVCRLLGHCGATAQTAFTSVLKRGML